MPSQHSRLGIPGRTARSRTRNHYPASTPNMTAAEQSHDDREDDKHATTNRKSQKKGHQNAPRWLRMGNQVRWAVVVTGGMRFSLRLVRSTPISAMTSMAG